MSDDDALTRELDLLWLRRELAALPRRGARGDPLTPLRTAARKALLLAQAGGDKAPDHATLERLILLLMVDRIYRSGGRQVLRMSDTRFQGALVSAPGQPDPFGLRFDVSRLGAKLDSHEGPMQ